jgi:AraC-like DNA-binding protein
MMLSDVAFIGAARDCAMHALDTLSLVETKSRLESRLEWDDNGYSGSVTDVTLRSGMQLCIFTSQAKKRLTLPVDGSPTDLMFTMTRGTGVTVKVNDDAAYFTGNGTLEITQIKRPVKLDSITEAGASNEFVVLSVPEEIMRELLSVRDLPPAVRTVLESDEPHARVAVPMGAELAALTAELLERSSPGDSRQLHLEARGLQLLAKIFDRLSEAAESASRFLSASDIRRAQQVKEILVAQLDCAPVLHELARHVGVNQTKLKADFRAVFGAPIYSYLRDHRMSVARQLLQDRDYNVTQVAARVGYANPSKFASAFRRHFGISPSAFARSSQQTNRSAIGYASDDAFKKSSECDT